MPLIQADARQIPLRDGCVQCVVTSPPYFGLRDYGTANQIGLEPTPDAFVAALVGVFREVRRVLADDGVVWLNLGDSYVAAPRGNAPGDMSTSSLTNPQRQDAVARGRGTNVPQTKNPNVSYPTGASHRTVRPEGLKSKDLIGIPWRAAFALQADGWYLRSDIIWHKPNPMPESVTDRPTKAHEYLFLLTKNAKYYYDHEAVKEACSPDMVRRAALGHTRGANGKVDASRQDATTLRGDAAKVIDVNNGRNMRDVWSIATQPFKGAHFATMPEKLVEPCIFAGSRLGDRVFDPFMGSGTVGAVAERLGRRWVGTDLNPDYLALATRRTFKETVHAKAPLFAFDPHEAVS
jgi:DNA modification methylase